MLAKKWPAAAAAKNLTAATVGGSFPVGAVVRISRKSLAKVGEASIIPSPQQQLGDPTGGETKQKTRKSSGETQENDSSRVSDSKHRRRNSAPQSSFRDQRRRNAHPFTVIVDSDNNTTTTTSTSSWSKSSSSNLLDWTLEQVSCGAGLCVVADPALLDDRPDCIPSRYLRNNSSSSSSSSSTRHSLYRRTMTTAALVNEEANATAATASPQQQQQQQQQQDFNHNLAFKQTAAFARGFADDAGRAIGNLLPKASLQQLTTRKYTLPDKTVASQVLMYRQLLHTKCRPGLKLSRDFQGTPAQKAVMHMPWWEEGIEQTKKMTISYDNLITRLWLNGAIDPFIKDGSATATSTPKPVDDTVDFLDLESNSNSKEDNDDAVPATKTADDSTTANSVETYITDAGLPPVPHLFWVERLGFQQNDPVTDFRSGGVLSLAMMVYMVESHPAVCQRFFTGDASVLPFGITCINVTDMIAKFLMLAKATDRMDALLSQKPFWRMFADPNAILAVQELAMTMLADVVVELTKERQVPALAKKHSSSSMHGGESSNKVTVFDFSTILERTERRVRDDLLGAGPKTVGELRSMAGRLSLKYRAQLERRIQRALQHPESVEEGTNMADAIPQQQQDEGMTARGSGGGGGSGPPPFKDVLDKAGGAAGAIAGVAGAFAGGFFAKVKNSGAAFGNRNPAGGTPNSTPPAPRAEPVPTIVDLPPPPTPTTVAAAAEETEGDWVGTDIASATDAISNFSIGDEDEDEIL